MEKTRNSFIDLFKNFGFVINKLVNSGEIDEVELTGDLAKDPAKIVEEYNASEKAKSIEEAAKRRAKEKSQDVSIQKKTSTRTVSKTAVDRKARDIDDDGLDL
jgi:hypothetical protein